MCSKAVQIIKGKERRMRYRGGRNKNFKFTKARWSDKNRRIKSYLKKCHSRQRHQINKLILCITIWKPLGSSDFH